MLAVSVDECERLAFGETKQRDSAKGRDWKIEAGRRNHMTMRENPRVRITAVDSVGYAAAYRGQRWRRVLAKDDLRGCDFSIQQRSDRVVKTETALAHDLDYGEIFRGEDARFVRHRSVLRGFESRFLLDRWR